MPEMFSCPLFTQLGLILMTKCGRRIVNSGVDLCLHLIGILSKLRIKCVYFLSFLLVIAALSASNIEYCNHQNIRVILTRRVKKRDVIMSYHMFCFSG